MINKCQIVVYFDLIFGLYLGNYHYFSLYSFFLFQIKFLLIFY